MRPNRKKDAWRVLPGLVISLVLLVTIFSIVDWRDVFLAFQQADHRYILMGLLVYLISFTFRAQAWRMLLMESVPFRRVFLVMQTGYFLNNVLPLRLGEVGRAYLLGRTGLGFWRVLSTIMLERAFDMILAISLLLGTLPYVGGALQEFQTVLGIGCLAVMGLLVLFFLARNQERVLSWYQNRVAHYSIFSKVSAERIESFLTGLSALASLNRFLGVFGWMIASWGLALVYTYLLLLAFVPRANPLWSAFGVGSTSLGIAIPSSPGYVGVYESIWIGVLSLFEVPLASALAFALVSHALYLGITAVFGAYGLYREGESLGDVFRSIRRGR